MASNLVSYVMQMLTPDVIGRIAAALGSIAARCRALWVLPCRQF